MSEVDWSRLRSLTAREIMAALIRDGFSLRGQVGSHRRYRHADGRRVTVSCHRQSDTFRPKTLRSIIEQAGWGEDDLRRLKLLSGQGSTVARTRCFQLLEVVYLRDAHPALGLAEGECGTIVETFDRPDTAYLVEFIHPDGSTKIEAAFTPDQLSTTPPR